MGHLRLQRARHLLMRITLGFILAWFGVQQVLNPSEWTDFIPAIISGHSPIAAVDLILLHGIFLLVAATGIILGLFFVGSCLMAAGIFFEIILVLLLNGNNGSLIVRDVGLLALAIALALDPVQFLKVTLTPSSWETFRRIQAFAASLIKVGQRHINPP